MDYLHTDRASHGQLRLLFGDRAISHRLGQATTLGDIARAVRVQDHGTPIAIDVTLGEAPNCHALPDFLPAGFMFQDDPDAEFPDSDTATTHPVPVTPAGLTA